MTSWWRNLVAGFWFVPGAVAAVHFLLAVALVETDRAFGEQGVGGFRGDSSAAREVLSTIAASIATIAGVVFSITIVVLTMVSSQFSPRALRSFLADRLNQFIAGAFVGIFAYCLVVLRAVRGDEITDRFVPGLAVTVAVGLGFAALALLIVFVHHMGESVQLAHIVARIGRQTLDSIGTLYPEEYGVAPDDAGAERVEEWRRAGPPDVVHPSRPGYVQSVSADGLAGSLARPGLRLHVPVRPGEFVTEGQALVEAWPAQGPDEETERQVRRCVPVTSEREVAQDAAYGLRQLTDIAVKALSPGVNDPSTALAALGYVRAVLERLVRRDIPAGVRRLEDAELVLRTRPFGEYVEEAFGPLARSGAGNVRVAAELLAALAAIARGARAVGARERLPILRELAGSVVEPARDAAANEHDRQSLEQAWERALPDLEPARPLAGRR